VLELADVDLLRLLPEVHGGAFHHEPAVAEPVLAGLVFAEAFGDAAGGAVLRQGPGRPPPAVRRFALAHARHQVIAPLRPQALALGVHLRADAVGDAIAVLAFEAAAAGKARAAPSIRQAAAILTVEYGDTFDGVVAEAGAQARGHAACVAPRMWLAVLAADGPGEHAAAFGLGVAAAAGPLLHGCAVAGHPDRAAVRQLLEMAVAGGVRRRCEAERGDAGDRNGDLAGHGVHLASSLKVAVKRSISRRVPSGST
jgi:hypothetical protein